MDSKNKMLALKGQSETSSTVPTDNVGHPSVEPTASTNSSKQATFKVAEVGSRNKNSKTNHRHRGHGLLAPATQDDMDSDDSSSQSDASDSSSSSSSDSYRDEVHLRGGAEKKKKRRVRHSRNSPSSKAKNQATAGRKRTKTGTHARKKTSSNVDEDDIPTDCRSSSPSPSTSHTELDLSDKENQHKRDHHTMDQQMQALQLEVRRLQHQLSTSRHQQQSAHPQSYGPSHGYGFIHTGAMHLNPGYYSGYPPQVITPPVQYVVPNPQLQPQTSPVHVPPVSPLDLSLKGQSARGSTGSGHRQQAGDDSDAVTELAPNVKNRRGKGAKGQFRRVDHIWDSTLYSWKIQDTVEDTLDLKDDEYLFHVRRAFDPDGKYRATFVDIKSKLIRECLQDVIGKVHAVSLVETTPKLDPNLLFLYLDDFRDHWRRLGVLEPAGSGRERKKNQLRIDDKRKQLRCLIKYLDRDYAKVKQALYPMLNNGLITYDLLWALWKPNTLVIADTYGSSDDPRAFRLKSATKGSHLTKGNYYRIEGKYFDFNGKRFGYGTHFEEIPEFSGVRKINTLPCYPLRYHKNDNLVREQLIARGKKFVGLGGMHYKSYSGMAYYKKKKARDVIKYHIKDSRVMVDPANFRLVDPNYSVSNVRPRDHDYIAQSDGESDSSEERGRARGDLEYVTQAFARGEGQAYLSEEPQGSQPWAHGANANSDELSEEEYLIASPIVLGFSLAEKHWMEFLVSGIRDIEFDKDAWDSLVLEKGTKDLIKALVQSRKTNAALKIDDVIQGKGKGLVTVLHGPPGTGKTLTAESISELLRCPLYTVSAGELGTNSTLLEHELEKILDISHSWGAILLLDEADVFLEKRNMQDMQRNSLVSIFLRKLEYFQGILFLTTNRVEIFDEAFQSRIHIALRYGSLDTEAKKSIFKMFLKRVKKLGAMRVEDFSESELAMLAKRELNGREIKNAVCSAQDLAASKDEPLGMDHLLQVLEVHTKFGRDLKGGRGYEEAMRSYF